ncbi:MAG: TerC family protein [Microbacteriaceae bacterium]|jgi:predicted tellurium resistance membrane protein TerC
MDWTFLADPATWVAFGTLLILEIVLGVDNVIFISILASKLPEAQRQRARTIGLTLAMVLRIGLLFAASWVVSLTSDLFELFGMGFSGKDLIMIAGGAFLLYKAVTEIHERLEGEEAHGDAGKAATFGAVIAQILALDVVFSLDSVITAVGVTEHLPVMVAAVVIAVGVMLLSAGWIGGFVEKHPTVKMLALSFLVLIGAMLAAEGFDIHIDKAVLYGAMGFAIAVEVLNLVYKSRKDKRRAKAVEPVHLRPARLKEDGTHEETPVR